MKLIHVDNPFRPAEGKTEREFFSRADLLAYIAEHNLSSQDYTLSLDGEIVAPEKLDGLALGVDACLVAMPVLGNRTLQSIAMIAVMVAAIYFAGPLGAALFPSLSTATATALGGAIISIGGTLLVNGIASLFQKQPGGAAYTFNGPQTTARSGIPISKGYGTFMAAPNIIQSWVDLQHADQDLHDVDDGASDIGRQWLNITACFGFGPAVSLTDIRINGNDISSYTDVAYFVKLGTNTQGVVAASDPTWTILNQTTTGSAPNTAPTTDFNRIVNNYPQSQRIRCDIAKNYVIVKGHRNDTQRLDVTVQFPRGVWRYDDKMVIKRLDIEYNVYYKLTTDTTWTLGQHHVYTNIRQSILRQITTIDNLPPGQYDVKVEKIGSGAHNNPIYAVEHESDYFGDELWLESVQETCYDALAYPNMILLGLRIMASDQIAGANIQITATVNYDVRSALPAQLSTYSPDNPALVAYDVLTDKLTGGGLDPNNINIPSFVEWATLCDTLVPSDSTGDTVKLAVFNGIFEDGNKSVWDDFASIGVMSRATPTRIGTQVAVMIDQADDPVQVFNVGNIYKDSYSKDYLQIDDRSNEVEVDYANANDDYKTRNPVRCIPADVQDSGYAIKKTRVNLLGCTSTVQAYYWGTHRLLELQLLKRTHKWDSPAQAIVSRIGDVVLLQHDIPKWAQGGLVVGGTASAPVLDAAYTYTSGQTLTLVYPILKRITGNISTISGNLVTVSGYDGSTRVTRLVACNVDVAISDYTSGNLTLVSSSGLSVGQSVDLYDTEALETASVTGITVANGQSTLTLAADLPADPIPDSPYILSVTSSQPIKVRIRGIKRTGDQKFTITAIDYNPNVYNIPVPNADDLLALTSGGSGGNSASTPDPTTTPPAAPPTGVVGPGDPGYLGSSLPSAKGSYTLMPPDPLTQPTSTDIELASVAVTYADDTQATYGPHSFTIADPGSTPTWYYVTTDGTSYYCDATTTKIGNPTYTYLGSILAEHVVTLPSYADNETVSGSGTGWTLAHAPNPVASLRLYQYLTGFGLVGLLQGTDFTISGSTITTTNSLSTGVLHAWYRY